MIKEELDKILEEHRKWLDDPNTGKKADFRGVDLNGVDLSGIDLSGAKLHLKE